MNWEEDTKTFDKMLSSISNLTSKEVNVGFFDDKYGDENENLYVAQVAQWQEEGHKDGQTFAPARPFFRVAFREEVNSVKYEKAFDKMLDNVFNGKESPHSGCKRLGEGLTLELQQIIEHGEIFAPNSERWANTKRMYYGTFLAPLVFTGKMRDSVKFKITTKGKNI